MNADDVDVREAAKSAIASKWGEIQKIVGDAIDSGIRGAIADLPEERSFDANIYYSAFISPQTRMISPISASKNVGAFFDKTFGAGVDAFFAQ